MITRVVLIALILSQSIFVTPSIAGSKADSGQQGCECMLQSSVGLQAIGSFEVTGGDVLAMSHNGYSSVHANTKTALFSGARFIAGPRSKSSVVFPGECKIDFKGFGEVRTKSVGNSVCVYKVKSGSDNSDRDDRKNGKKSDDRGHDKDRDRGRDRHHDDDHDHGCGRHDHRDRDRDDHRSFWGHGHGSGHGGCPASR